MRPQVEAVSQRSGSCLEEPGLSTRNGAISRRPGSRCRQRMNRLELHDAGTQPFTASGGCCQSRRAEALEVAEAGFHFVDRRRHVQGVPGAVPPIQFCERRVLGSAPGPAACSRRACISLRRRRQAKSVRVPDGTGAPHHRIPVVRSLPVTSSSNLPAKAAFSCCRRSSRVDTSPRSATTGPPPCGRTCTQKSALSGSLLPLHRDALRSAAQALEQARENSSGGSGRSRGRNNNP